MRMAASIISVPVPHMGSCSGMPGPPRAERDQRGGERFAQRRFAVPRAVTAAVERRAAGVERQLGDVAMQRDVDGTVSASSTNQSVR